MTLAEASHLTGVRNWADTATIHSPETTSSSRNQDRASAGATACTSNITLTSPGVTFGPLTGRNSDAIPLGVVKKLGGESVWNAPVLGCGRRRKLALRSTWLVRPFKRSGCMSKKRIVVLRGLLPTGRTPTYVAMLGLCDTLCLFIYFDKIK